MIENKAGFTKSEVEAIFGFEALRNIPEKWSCTGISIDTRTLITANLFVALKGEKIDGHSKLSEAIAKQAAAALVEKNWFDKNSDSTLDFPLIVVDNSLTALGKLANFHRRRFDIPIIAIGGSNGKTTTKNITAHLLSKKYSILKTHENFNNQLGTPLNLLCLNKEHELAVIEVGTNEPGEISILSNIVEPTHGLITNIGKEHLEGFIDLDGVEAEETSLFGYLYKHNGLAFINADDTRLSKYCSLLENKITYGNNPDFDLFAQFQLDEQLKAELKLTYEKRNITAKLAAAGITISYNAIAAAAVAFRLGLNENEIIEGIESFKPDVSHSYGRMLIESAGGITIINDSYNANPESMKAALESLKNYNSKECKYAVLGDMRELGDASYDEHNSILEIALDAAERIFITGEEFKIAYTNFSNNDKIVYTENKDMLLNQLLLKMKTGDIVLVKGSRGMAMETIVKGLKENKILL